MTSLRTSAWEAMACVTGLVCFLELTRPQSSLIATGRHVTLRMEGGCMQIVPLSEHWPLLVTFIG